MAFTVTARHSGNSATTAAQTLTTSSTTPTASSLLLLFWGQQRNFHTTAVSLQTPTGGSLTYTSIAASAEFSWSSLTEHSISAQMYRADVGGSPSAHTITVDSWSGTTTGYYAALVCDITGHDSSTPVQSKAGGASFVPETDAASGTLTLDSTPATGNLVVVAIDASADTAGGFAAPTIGGQSMTSLFNQNSGATQACMFYRVITGAESTNVITCSDMGNTVGNWAGVAVEIAVAGGGGATTGEKFPTSGTTTSESPWLDEAWVNPGNVVSDNAAYAQVTATTFDAGDQTQVLKATGFDFSSIPSGATIDGVTARIQARGDSVNVSLDLMQLLDTAGAKVGTNLASTPQALTTSDAVYTFGSSSNLWGNALTEAWVKDADFGVAIGAITSVANSEVYVDYVTLEIQYTAAADVYRPRMFVAPSVAVIDSHNW